MTAFGQVSSKHIDTCNEQTFERKYRLKDREEKRKIEGRNM